jgi:hypothetical protein
VQLQREGAPPGLDHEPLDQHLSWIDRRGRRLESFDPCRPWPGSPGVAGRVSRAGWDA